MKHYWAVNLKSWYNNDFNVFYDLLVFFGEESHFAWFWPTSGVKPGRHVILMEKQKFKTLHKHFCFYSHKLTTTKKHSKKFKIT